MDDQREGAARRRDAAVTEVIGALTYALLCSFQIAVRAIAMAPTMALAEQQADLSAEELERYRLLRAHLTGLTDDPHGAMHAFRGALDSFYEAARAEGWIESQVFTFVGDTITTDFAELLSERLDPETARAVGRALTGRHAQMGFALEQIGEALAAEPEKAGASVARFAGTMVGEGLNRLRDAMLESSTLEDVLGKDGVKQVALELLGRHRERLERLGLDTLDE